MSPYWIFGFVALVFIAIGVAVYASHLAEKKRTGLLEAIAAELRFQFDAKPALDVVADLSSLPLFGRGHSRKVKNLMSGEARGVAIAIFDYHFTTSSGQHQHPHAQSVVVARSAKLDLPNFELCPERFYHRIAVAFGFQDIDFDERPEFSRLFLLRGKNETAIRALFDENLFNYFEKHKDVTVEASMGQLAFYRSDKRVEPNKVQDFLKEGFELYALLQNGAG